jgi:hypothetical protein
MSREKGNQDKFATGPDPFSDGFDEGSGSRGGDVEVIHGVYSHTLPLAGATIAEARVDLADRMNIDPEAVAVIDGEEAGNDAVLREGQVLNFVKAFGERGALERVGS